MDPSREILLNILIRMYFIDLTQRLNTVGQHGNENSIANYVKNQGVASQYQVLLKKQLTFF